MKAGALRYGCGPAVFVAAFAVYLLTLCPTVYVEGSGELIGAVHFLGTPHPTGYPLFCLWARLFSAFLPWGGVALKVNVASACAGALAAGALAVLLQGRGCAAWAGLAAGLGLGFSRTFWSQAVIAEVYGLSLLLAVAVLGVGLQAIQARDERYLLLTAFLMGLGLTTHLNQVLVWPGLLLVLLGRWPGIWRRGALLAGAGVAWLGGYSLVLYLPLRSGSGPGFHWGPLDAPGPLWDHLTGALYRSSFFSLPWEGMLHNASRWWGQAAGEFHPLLVPAFAWGAWSAWRRDREALAGFGLMILMNLAAVLNYHRDPNGLGVFFLPSFVGLAGFLGYALDDLGRRLGRSGVVLAGLVVPLAVLGTNWEVSDRSDSRVAARYGRDILSGLPAGAVVLAEGDDASFVLDYLLRVEGAREDVTLFNRVGRGTDLLQGEERRLSESLRARMRQQREAALIRDGERPVFFLAARGMPLPGYGFLPEGLAYRAAPVGERPRSLPVDLDNAQDPSGSRDPWTRRIQANYWFMLAEQQRAAGYLQEAIHSYEKAAAVAFDSRTVRFNVALALYRSGELERSWTHAAGARDIDPWQEGPYRLMARIAQRQGRQAEAQDLLKRAADAAGSP